jgi:hypothetical protein
MTGRPTNKKISSSLCNVPYSQLAYFVRHPNKFLGTLKLGRFNLVPVFKGSMVGLYVKKSIQLILICKFQHKIPIANATSS